MYVNFNIVVNSIQAHENLQEMISERFTKVLQELVFVNDQTK